MPLFSAQKAPACPHVRNDLATLNEALAGKDVHLLVMICPWPGAVHSSISLSLLSHPCSHNFISLFATPSVVLLIRSLLQWLLLRKVGM